jgi:hypothetical protein
MLACVASVSLSAGNVQSNFVPGDFGLVADELGIAQENGYYDLGHILGSLVERVQALEAVVADQRGQLDQLAQSITTLSSRVNQEAAPSPAIVWVNAADSFRRERDVTLVFQTMPGATCHLDVLYLTSGKHSTSPAVQVPRVANEQGVVQWTWGLSAAGGQDALVTLDVDMPDGTHASASWRFAVLD